MMDDFEKRYEVRFVMSSDPPIEKQILYARGAYIKLKAMDNIIGVFDAYFAWRQQNIIGFFSFLCRLRL